MNDNLLYVIVFLCLFVVFLGIKYHEHRRQLHFLHRRTHINFQKWDILLGYLSALRDQAELVDGIYIAELQQWWDALSDMRKKELSLTNEYLN